MVVKIQTEYIKLGQFLKKLFISKFWIKAMALILSIFVVFLLNAA